MRLSLWCSFSLFRGLRAPFRNMKEASGILRHVKWEQVVLGTWILNVYFVIEMFEMFRRVSLVLDLGFQDRGKYLYSAWVLLRIEIRIVLSIAFFGCFFDSWLQNIWSLVAYMYTKMERSTFLFICFVYKALLFFLFLLPLNYLTFPFSDFSSSTTKLFSELRRFYTLILRKL